VGPEIETFFGPEMATSPPIAIWDQIILQTGKNYFVKLPATTVLYSKAPFKTTLPCSVYRLTCEHLPKRAYTFNFIVKKRSAHIWLLGK
jgi:hypothetical protein